MMAAFSEPVLLVEDTPSLSTLYEAFLVKAGYRVECAYDTRGALDSYKRLNSRLILLDLVLPDGDGLAVLAKIKQSDPGAKVIVITANGSINRAVEAMRGGAFDFLVKPFDERRLIGAVGNAAALLSREERGAEPLPGAPDVDADGLAGFIGQSVAMRRIYAMVGSIARSTATVFITGESGTGKEVCAQAIHDLSIRSSGPFIAINCGAIPRDLLESELFGHLRGSFTGAVTDKRGAAAAADGGTLFLDEICEMDLALQTKLLRFLQTSMIQPVGASEAQKVDVRIVCATNRDPGAEVRAARFREDLYYRLHVVPIHLPPLRDRDDDVLRIAERLLRRFAGEEGKRFERLSDAVKAQFLTYSWPGNVRELQNVLRNAVVLHDGSELLPSMLPEGLSSEGPAAKTRDPEAEPAAPEPGKEGMNGGHDALRHLVGIPLADLERRFIQVTIDECKGSIPRAARLLDVSPSTLYRKRDAWARNGD